MDINENEEQKLELDLQSGETPAPEESIESSELGDELQPAPEVEEVVEEEASSPVDDADLDDEPALELDPDDLVEEEVSPDVEDVLDEEADLDLPDEETEVEVVVEEELPEVEVQAELDDQEPEEIEPAQAVEQEEIAPDPYASVTMEDEPVQAPDDDRAWYVVHCYSGNEDKVRHNIMQRIESMSMDDLIFDVVVPTEDEVNIKNGERQTVEKKVFPGYILVNMILTEESWYMVRNTPGVTGFVGMGNDPTPLQPEEVARILKRMESESPRINVTFRAGERVRIVDGPFEDFYGKVAEIDMERATVRVMVNFFGRETPVELDFLQVEQA
jgi:transcriptional antiterminator NusG